MSIKRVSKYRPDFSSERGVLENSIGACSDFECVYKDGVMCGHSLSENFRSICNVDTCAFGSNCYCCKKQPGVDDDEMKPKPILCRKSGERSMLDKTGLPEDVEASKRQEAINTSGFKRKTKILAEINQMADYSGFEQINRNNIKGEEI